MHNPKRWLSINLQYDFCNIHKKYRNIQPIRCDVHLTLTAILIRRKFNMK